MKTIQIRVSEADFIKYNLNKEEIKFSDLVDIISREHAKKALKECNSISLDLGLSEMTLEDINKEINEVRKAKNHS